MLNKRKSRRRTMVLPVRVSVDHLTSVAHTVDITITGAQLGGLRTQLQPGMIIILQRGSKKAEFRVRFVRQLGKNELRAGIESVEPDDNFWGVDLSDELEAEISLVNFSV
jgi:hypothetical protein